jgi:hypothetical protein
MALPIKSNSTQEGCNPTSSNCVIWQGPDIPCINLCKGDTISDVTAKLAEELCDILNQLDISTYTLTCFNPICPNPSNFHDLIQFIINKLCELANADEQQAAQASNCPDQCFIPIPACFGDIKDCLGNSQSVLTLKDFAILLGNKICDLIAQLAITDANVADLEDRVTALESAAVGFRKSAAGTDILIANSCLTGAPSTPIKDFVKNLETAFCALRLATGDPTAINTALGFQCAGLNAAPQLDPAAGGAAMGLLPGWNLATVNLAQSFSNLWQTVCDLRAAVATLQTDLAACCTPTCADIAWDFTGTWIAPNNIVLAFSGSVPVSFSYCNPTDGVITIYDAYSNSYTVNTQDIVAALGGTINIDISVAPNLVPSVYYTVSASMCLTNGSVTCGSNDTYSWLNNAFCPSLTVASPNAGELAVSFSNAVTTNAIEYTVRVYDAGTNLLITSYVWSGSSLGGALSNTFTGLAAGTYYAVLSTNQNGHVITCSASANQVVA